MKTPTSDLMTGVLLWMLIMAMPLLILFIENVQVRMTLLYLIFPSAISFLARNPHFLISQTVIFGASMAAFLFYIGLNFVPKIRTALKNPTTHKSTAGGVMGGLMGMFFFVILAWGMSGMIYGPEVVGQAPNNGMSSY